MCAASVRLTTQCLRLTWPIVVPQRPAGAVLHCHGPTAICFQAWTSSSVATVWLFFFLHLPTRSLRIRCVRYGRSSQLSTEAEVNQVETVSIVQIGPRTDMVKVLLQVLTRMSAKQPIADVHAPTYGRGLCCRMENLRAIVRDVTNTFLKTTHGPLVSVPVPVKEAPPPIVMKRRTTRRYVIC